jgi:alpha-1,3-rhamnosyltransferase
MKIEKPLVSIVIPSYNHAKYIRQAIESVLNQTYLNIELIVIDDGSKDHSVEIIQELADAHGFTFIAQENKSLPVTLNIALQMAKGELFCEFSSDDFLSTDYIEKQVLFMQDNLDVALVAATLTVVDGSGKIEDNKCSNLSPRKYTFDDVVFNGMNVPAPGMVFRKKVLEEVGGFSPEIQLEDLQIQLKITHAGHLITINPEAKVFYRLHGENNVLRKNWMADQMLATINEYQDHEDFNKIRKFWYLRVFKIYAKVDKPKAKRFIKEVRCYWFTKDFWKGIRRILFSLG